MALLARPRDRARHAARTPLLQQIGWRRRSLASVAGPQRMHHQPAPSGPAGPTGVDRARSVVGNLTGAVRQMAGVDLYPLDWKYQDGAATGHVDSSLPPDVAREILAAYAIVMTAVTLAENTDGRLWLRASRSVEGVVVTVRADVTPPAVGSELLEVPEWAPVSDQMRLPIERLAHCALDDTQVFDAITDDTPAPQELDATRADEADDDTAGEENATVDEDPAPAGNAAKDAA